jgi:hypothetical protein
MVTLQATRGRMVSVINVVGTIGYQYGEKLINKKQL